VYEMSNLDASETEIMHAFARLVGFTRAAPPSTPLLFALNCHHIHTHINQKGHLG
jgi:hypothetical protein